VGGTTLFTTGPPSGSWSSETAWNWYITDPPYTNSTGGGINFHNVPIPSWQQGINMTTNLGSTTLRNVPDVALTADNIFVVADNGTNYEVGGTSAAAPLWAGFTALINQQATTFGYATVGFLNPAIYAIGKGSNYNLDFHDITTGNNTNRTVNNKYFAVPGYDLCTGWGTPNGANLINALAPPPALAPVAFQIVTQTNNAILFTWNSVTGLVYQVQYKTNLLQTDWLDLGNPITATDITTTTFDIIGTDPDRFYRVQETQ